MYTTSAGSGIYSNYTNALLHSLYLSALLTDLTPAMSSTPGRLAQVAQTLAHLEQARLTKAQLKGYWTAP